MATSKTLAPTNVTISIPAMTDQPNASVLANCADKEADAINALNSQMGGLHMVQLTKSMASGYFGITSSEIPFGKKLIIQKVYTQNNTFSDYTFSIQANSSGSAYMYYVYVRQGGAVPADSEITVNILYMN